MAARRVAWLAVALVVLLAAVWYLRSRTEAAGVRRQLDALAREVTNGSVDAAARTARLGRYFAEDAVVDLGQGTAPIEGRETVIGMAARLQPRTAVFELKLDDISVSVSPDGETADVTLTVELRRRSLQTDEESMDAREFAAQMRKVGGDWQIARLTAVQALRR